MSEPLDLVIIGAGVAGLSAAIQAARLGLNTMVVAEMGVGGQIMNAPHIDNFPGIPEALGGYDLGPILHEQAETAGASFMFDRGEALEAEGDQFMVRGDSEVLVCRAVIVAAGSKPRKLGLPGEERLTGRGVSHCASCDGPLFRNKHVMVVGGGDAAFDEALVLADHARQVTILCRNDRPRAQKILRDRADARANIELRCGVLVEEIIGDSVVTGLAVRGTGAGGASVEPCDGVFVSIGSEPNTQWLGALAALTSDGQILVDAMMQTSVPGLFAAGVIRAGSVGLLATAAGDGVTAAVAAARYLARN